MKVLIPRSKVKVNEIKLDVSTSAENIYAGKELTKKYTNVSLPPLIQNEPSRLSEAKRQPRNTSFQPARLSINNLRTLEQLQRDWDKMQQDPVLSISVQGGDQERYMTVDHVGCNTDSPIQRR